MTIEKHNKKMYDQFGKEYQRTRKEKHKSRLYNEFLEVPCMIKAVGNIKGKKLPKINEGHVFHQYTIRITPQFSKTREELITILKNNDIGTGIFYPLPIHKQKSFQEYNHLSLPVSEKLANQVLSLPIGPYLTTEDQDKIIQIIKNLK